MKDVPYFKSQVETLQLILDGTRDKRVCAVGTTCIGKTTLVETLSGAYDMDEILFPLLTLEEQVYVCQDPWTKEIGQTMTRLAKERIKVEVGKPIFGTIIFDSDIIIYLCASEYLLRQRTLSRGKNCDYAFRMQEQIEQEIKNSEIQYIRFLVG